MFTVKQAAQKLGVSPQLIYELIATSKLPCFRIGVGRGTIRISEEDLDAYLASTKEVHEPASTKPRTFTHLDV